ncbi:AraC family transcriptional regulator [Thermincola ferriacetica]|uniref:AraC family transcriptional regulator n=1 Tax=Thermincola ferriacetica TaxID=281456 RepID=A0A0L6W2Y0_9FIRM|nr:AraC family transcriptional regulator [Thermincola ferriacetica]KNZ69912.1 AraC family transcriptional regulator [Thermincola ferriacetica]
MSPLVTITKNRNQHLLQKERELASKIRVGELDHVWDIFDDILMNIYRMELYNIEVIKVRVLELMLVLSRAAIDSGADYGKISEINHDFVTYIAGLKTIEGVSQFARQILQAYIESRPAKNPRGEELVQQVKEFILKNYHRRITLEDIAKSVHISQYYLSHLFKEVEGISVIEYLTKVRIEKAKILLRNPKYSIYEISEKLGFKEPSYFTRVFRSREGRTPSQFRKLG